MGNNFLTVECNCLFLLDAGTDAVWAGSSGLPLLPVGGAVEARHDAMLPGPVVDVVQVFIEDISKFYISEKCK